MNENKTMKNSDGLQRSTDRYLNRLVTTKKALFELATHDQIRLCNTDLCVHVYEGIGELAAAAGQTLSVKQRNCQDFPLELYFVHQDVTFCQLKSTAALEALGLGEM